MIQDSLFYALEIEDWMVYCCYPVCPSVILSETSTSLITLEQCARALIYHMSIPKHALGISHCVHHKLDDRLCNNSRQVFFAWISFATRCITTDIIMSVLRQGLVLYISSYISKAIQRLAYVSLSLASRAVCLVETCFQRLPAF